jgi:hypothetical protein
MKKDGPDARVAERDNPKYVMQSANEPAKFSGKLVWEGERNPPGYLVDFKMVLLNDQTGKTQR